MYARFLKLLYRFDGIVYLFFDTIQREPEGIDGTLQAFEHVDSHEPSNTFLSSGSRHATSLLYINFVFSILAGV